MNMWPKELDAVIAAPNSHKILFENDRLRVTEVTILPGRKEPLHTHECSSVMMVDSSTKIAYYDESGKVTEYPESEASQEKPFVEWLEPEGPHAVENLDQSKIYHAVRIELK